MPKKSETGVKILTNDETKTKKVNKIQEIKLRNLMRKLTYENEMKSE